VNSLDERYEKRMISIENEQSILGAILRTNRAVDQIGDLMEADFYNAEHRVIFHAIMKLVMANKPADVITVFECIQSEGRQIDIGYLNTLCQSTPSAANIAHYCAIVRDRALRRDLLAVAHELIEDAHGSPEDGRALVDSAASKLEVLGRANTTGEPELAADSLIAHMDRIDAEYHGTTPAGISTGLTDLDKALNGGPRRGNLVVLAGRPKMGKTALALRIVNHVAEQGVGAVLSMEMSKSELNNRNLASIGRINLNRLNDPKQLTDDDWQAMTRATITLSGMRLYLDDQGGLTLMQVRSKAMQIKRKAGGLDLLVIDYLQLMSGPGDSRNAQIESITRGLKSMAKELNCVVLLLSQLNRKLEDRQNKRPQPADLRDSGSIEQDCDIAIFVYRDEIYNKDSQDAGVAELIVALNRQGANSTVHSAYLGEYTRFEDVARNWHPTPPKAAPTPRRGFDD